MDFGNVKPLPWGLPGTENSDVSAFCTIGVDLIFVKPPRTQAFAGNNDTQTDRAVADVVAGDGRISAINRMVTSSRFAEIARLRKVCFGSKCEELALPGCPRTTRVGNRQQHPPVVRRAVAELGRHLRLSCKCSGRQWRRQKNSAPRVAISTSKTIGAGIHPGAMERQISPGCGLLSRCHVLILERGRSGVFP